jgi:hypothetical protein
MPRIWHIYYVDNCRHTRPFPKSKFVVIVCHDSNKFMGFLINTRIHPYIQKRPNLLACQAIIDVANHDFLNVDSYVDCIELYEFEKHELKNHRGAVGLKAKEAIKLAVDKSKTITPYYKRLIIG